jgi:hypothetical protein
MSAVAKWVWCWACYQVVVRGPRLPFEWELRLLPWAGLYAYSSWSEFRALEKTP